MIEAGSSDIKSNILIVDDSPENLDLLMGMLKQKGYKVRPAPNGELAIQAANNEPPDLIILDITMPGMDGYQVCKQLKTEARLREIPVIFISALSETMDKIKAFSAGGVDFVTKPFQFDEVHARVETHLKIHHLQAELERTNKRLEELVQAQVREISESQMATIFALASLSESRDDDTGKHLERVRLYCRYLATALKENPGYTSIIDHNYIENISHASPLHDIGKVAIPDNILLKQAKLTFREFAIMKTHSALGAETLETVQQHYPGNQFISIGIEIARHHHERWDGRGYPCELTGNSIPLSARIMAVVDVYDALRSRRCYKPAFSHEKSYDIIIKGSGTQFDPDVVNAFIKISDKIRKTGKSLYDE